MSRCVSYFLPRMVGMTAQSESDNDEVIRPVFEIFFTSNLDGSKPIYALGPAGPDEGWEKFADRASLTAAVADTS